MKREYVMALDAGTGAARCFLVSLDGRECHEAYQEWAYEYPPDAQPGGAEFSPRLFWGVFVGLIRRVLRESRIASAQVVGVSSTCQREGVVFLDRGGMELYAGPNIDMRAPANAEELAQTYGDAIYRISGHWPFPMFAPYRLLWFKERRPDIYSKIDCMLLINDWILYRLCGERASEPSNAVETLLFNLTERQWARELIERLGLPYQIFPPVFPSGTQIGGVTRRSAQETGLREGTPVITGGADTQCALLGTGSIKPGQASTVLGTFAPSQIVVDRPVIDPRRRTWSGCHVVPDRWVVESTAMETGQSFRWVRDVFFGGGDTGQYSRMDQEAATSPLGARGIQAFVGPRVPNYSNLKFNVRGGFYFNLPPLQDNAGRADFTRSVLESVAYGVRANIERLESVSGVSTGTLAITGGLSKSLVLREALANTMNKPIGVPRNKEGSALGAALCASVGSRRFSSFEEAVKCMVQWETVVSSQKEKADRYEQLYRAWLERMPEAYGAGNLGEIG